MESLTGYMRVRNTHFFFSRCVNLRIHLLMEDGYSFVFCFFPTISEEVFASNGAIWWSSTGKYLAYVEFNDTDVHKVEFSWFGSEQYPETVIFPYPKVGHLFCTGSINSSHSRDALSLSLILHVLCIWIRLDLPSPRSSCLLSIPPIHPVVLRWSPLLLSLLGLYILQFVITASLK